MKCLVCLLEGPSERELLKNLLPRFLSDEIEVHYIVFEGKQDLEKQLERRIKFWQRPQSHFLVMRDQDSDDCRLIKTSLQAKVNRTGKQSTSIVRIACHELESFYLGDLAAVEMGLSVSGLANKQEKSKYRTPDNLGNPVEELSKLTKNRYQKISGSRAIGPHLKIDGTNRSHSFNVLLAGIINMRF